MSGELERLMARSVASARWRGIAALLVGLAGIAVAIALGSTMGEASRQRDAAIARQSHSYEVMILTQSLAATMARAEATLGRFVISGDKAIGRIYVEDWRLAASQIDRLDRVTGDNPTQRSPIAALRAAYRERGTELSRIALNTNFARNDVALSRYYAARNSPSLGRVQDAMEAIAATERRLLDQRQQAARATIARSNLIAAILAGFGVVLVLGGIVLGWITVRTESARAIADAEAEIERARAVELEAAVAAATAELQQEARDREAAEAQLRQVQKMEAVGQLTGGIAHDFNNMLAVVLGGLELARRNVEGTSDAVRHLDNATEGANRAAALTRRLLAFARAEPLLPEAVEAGHLIHGMSDLLDRTLGDAITVEARDAGLGWHIWVDRHQLENALLNLAVNARDAMDGRGTLTIETGGCPLGARAVGECPPGEYVTISVSDTGCGMSQDVLERVFEPFFTTKPVGKGTGLGLSQIFGFVRQSQGEIAIRSVVGEGSVVTLYLPRHVGAVVAATATPIDAAIPAATGRTILVVEDDPRVLASTVDVIGELGHVAIACDDPLAAPAILAEHPAIDLVVSDVLMPGQSGPEMVAGLVADRPDVAVVFVTGFAADIEDRAAFGGHAVLRKPFTFAALARAIDEAGGDSAPLRAARRTATG
ncbi:ATP-binding protein [Sphingomonas japonica]|uniref:histidine kinase n=1 Tax=Sphingomonas japonica TaxID=511662 RepID=A0ABX0U064_9SPHN|nr:ATP-binding protein [Sphingomonas japonica]NIJ22792.1 signal transduction histidine kinase/ActR/RegA family two-component response regulator [Sphingomonas japonica]